MLISALTNGWRGSAAPAPARPEPQQPQETAPRQEIQPVPPEEKAAPVPSDPTSDSDAGYDPEVMARAAESRGGDEPQAASEEPTEARPDAAPVARPVDPAPSGRDAPAAAAVTVTPDTTDAPRPAEEEQARRFAEHQLQRDRLLSLAKAGYAEVGDLFRPARPTALSPADGSPRPEGRVLIAA